MGLARNSASSPLSIVTGDLLLGSLKRFLSLIGLYSDESVQLLKCLRERLVS